MTPDQFRAVADLFPDPALLVGGGDVLAVNRAARDRLGLDPDQIAGRPLGEFVASEPAALDDYLRACARTREPVPGSLTIDAGGRRARWRCEGSVVRPREGGAGPVLLLRLTPREEAAGRFLALNERVEQLGRELARRRRAEDEMRAQQARLEAAEAELQRQHAARDEFQAMLAHELRNPLAPMLTSLRVLRLAADDPQAAGAMLAILDRQVRQLTRLVDDLLMAARLTRRQVELRRERLDLAELARTAAEDRRGTFAEADLGLAVDVPAEPAWVAGDRARLTQVLGNLLDNAAKFTDPGGRIEVRVAADAGRGEAVLAVRDTGAGIDAALLPRLFEPYSQAEQSLHRTKGGLGLGLALVKGLTELHGGRVEARSDGPGRGAEFVVRLPLAQ